MRSKSQADDESIREFFWVLRATLNLVLWIVVISVLAVFACWFAGYYRWRADSIAAMQALLHYYLVQCTNLELAQHAAGWAYWSWFGWNRIELAIQSPVADYRNLPLSNLREPILIAMYALQLFGVRLAMLILVAPKFGLIIGLALIDGLVARVIRRENGGHESATRYHRAKRLLKFGLLPLAATGWLVAPVKLPFEILFLPVVSFCALLVWTMAKYYKKYY